MKQFECRCKDNFTHIDNGISGSLLVNLKKDKIYTCELFSGSYNIIRVYDHQRFIWFDTVEQFSKYFDYNQYLRKKKLEKLNLAISAKKN